jgi:predicted RNA-binding Zn-ribbon protein involved in translation (DUF1610 family)
MPTEPEWCLECDRDLEVDESGERWACRACGRWGTYTIAPNGWRVREVRSARAPEPAVQPKRGRA